MHASTGKSLPTSSKGRSMEMNGENDNLIQFYIISSI